MFNWSLVGKHIKRYLFLRHLLPAFNLIIFIAKKLTIEEFQSLWGLEHSYNEHIFGIFMARGKSGHGFPKEYTSNIWKRDCFPHLQTLNMFFVCRWNLLPGPLSRLFWEKSGCWGWSFNQRPRRTRHGQACGSARKISCSLSARLQTGPGQTEIGKDEPGRIPLVWSFTFHVSLNYTSSGLRLAGG